MSLPIFGSSSDPVVSDKQDVAPPASQAVFSSKRDLLFAGKIRRFARQDCVFSTVIALFALLVSLSFLGLFLMLLKASWPVLRELGWRFFTGTIWNPAENVYGALVALCGTVLTSSIALLIAVPVSFGFAVFLTEICPLPLRRPLGMAMELLAGIPSVIYGFWGLFVLVPLLQKYVQPLLQSTKLPLFQGPPLGVGLFSAGIILALMTIPFIASVMRDVFEATPPMLRESAYGLGCTTWEVVRRIMLPYGRVGIVGGVMLGLGRSLGETMAVTFVIGNSSQIPQGLFSPGSSIASTLANEFAEAEPKLHVPALFALGLLLFLVTFLVLAISKWLVQKKSHRRWKKNAF